MDIPDFMERFVCLLVFGLLGILRLFPLWLCVVLGRAAGAAAWLLAPAYRRLARANLGVAFGRELDARRLRICCFSHFCTLGANLFSAARFFGADEKLIRRHTTMENLELLRQAHAKGRGVVLAISHIGNWELFAQACFYASELPFGTVFQKLRNRRLDAWLTRTRERRGVRTFDRRRGLAAAARFLRGGGVLGVLVDQHAGDSGVWTPFFGKLASTSPLAASLAVKTGAAVVPVAIFTSGFARWRISVRPEIPWSADAPEQLTADINRMLESQIRESPSDWFWVHNRWKLPAPDFLPGRSKRGVYLPPGVGAEDLQPLRVVLRSSNWLGDAVMSMPAARCILAGRPDLRLSVLAPAKIAPAWQRLLPEVAEVIPIPARASAWRVASLLRGRFDAAIVFPNSFRSAFEVWLAGIPRRAGFPGHRRRWLLNSTARPPKPGSRPQHHSLHYLRLAKFLGATESACTSVARPPPADSILLGVCPGAEYGPAKRWPLDRLRAVMEAVSSRRDCQWVILGIDKDTPAALDLARNFPGKVTDLTGKTDIGELIDRLRELRLLLTNDTGTMHLAAILGVPTVAIFGSTEPALTGPVGAQHTVLRHQVECSPCFLRRCPLDFRCMLAIEPEEVVEAVLSRLETVP